MPENIIPERLVQHSCDAFFCNRSYGPRSQSRDKQLQSWCQNHAISYCDYQDFLLVEPLAVEQRKVFTPFYNLWKKQLVATVPDFVQGNYTLQSPTNISSPTIARNNSPIYDSIDAGENSHRPVDWAHKRIKSFALTDYEQTRNNVDIDGTTRLSPYMRFGLVSIRELFQRGIHVHKNKH